MKNKILKGFLIGLLACACMLAFATCGSDAEAPSNGEHDHNHEGEQTETDPCNGKHTEVIDPAREPNCVTGGLTEGKHCSVCNKTLVHQLIITPLGHDFVNGVCSRCSVRLYSEGLEYTVQNGICYVSGIGTCTDKEIKIPATSPDGVVVKGVAEKAFLGCGEITSVKLPKNVTVIGVQAFKNCQKLVEVKLPEALESIGEEAFSGCHSFLSVEIGKGVTSIGKNAFTNCFKLESLSVAAGNTTYHAVGNCLIETATKTLVLGCKNSVIPADGSVTSIGDGAFWGCLSLSKLVIPNTVTSIGDGAFVACNALVEVVIPNSVTKLGQFVFLNCTALKSVTLPAGLEKLNTQLFFNCTALSNITYQGTSAQWEVLSKGSSWNENVPAASVVCSNGSVSLK